MFLEDLAKPSEVERLIILEQNQTQVEFTEGQFHFVQRFTHGWIVRFFCFLLHESR